MDQSIGSNNFMGIPSEGAHVQAKHFGHMLRAALGEPAWSQLAPAITRRFVAGTKDKPSLRFIGTMQWVYCSPMGALIAKLIRRFSILPDICARHSDFSFDIHLGERGLSKERNYYLADDRRFRFVSRFADTPRLHEEFSGGIGMYLRLKETGGALLFCDEGYFLRIFMWRIPLPAWMTVGRFELLHSNRDERRFQIIIRVVHPIFGLLFYQRGEFEAA